MIINITSEQDGKLLRDVIKNLGVSRLTLIHLKNKEDGILLDGKRVTVRALARAGSVLELKLEDCEEDVNPNVVFCGEMPEILYEDEAVLAINKPAGMPTHTSFGHYDDSLANAVLAYYSKKGIPFVFRAVNRLDKDTSGIVLIAKNRYFGALLSEYMAKGKIKKKYLAIVSGHTDIAGKIEGYISREAESIIKRRFSSEQTEGADYSLTFYEKIAGNDEASAVVVSPETGRTHQIRVHFASLGCPLVGDGMYGSESGLIGRHALHAFFLEFPLPDGRIISLSAPIPDDMKILSEKLGLSLELR